MGIDPGMAIVGYCIVDVNKDNFTLVTSGSIQTNKQKTDGQRLAEIRSDMLFLLDKYSPDVASVEQLFFFKNVKTIIPVAQARGVIVETLAVKSIPIYEYTPLVVKQTLTGYGRATKSQVAEMVRLSLCNQAIPKLDDTVDSIAIAICHARNFDNRTALQMEHKQTIKGGI